MSRLIKELHWTTKAIYRTELITLWAGAAEMKRNPTPYQWLALLSVHDNVKDAIHY